MKRAAFLYCANVEPERYKVLDRRGQTPLAESPEKNEFTFQHAFRLRLALDLIGGEDKDKTQLQGLPPDYASSVVFNVTRIGWALDDDQGIENIAAASLWAGVVAFEYVPPDADSIPDEIPVSEGYRWSAWFVGELHELPSFIEAKKAEEDAYGHTEAVRIFIADASACARGVLRRAEEMGIA